MLVILVQEHPAIDIVSTINEPITVRQDNPESQVPDNKEDLFTVIVFIDNLEWEMKV